MGRHAASHSGSPTTSTASALFAVVIGLTLAPIVLSENGLADILPIAVMDDAILYFSRKLIQSQMRHGRVVKRCA
jgi:hypothetical protein